VAANKNKKQIPSLKEVFLRENEMSHRYGLDMDTPKGVYVPDTTRNKVIASTAEEPIDEDLEECGCEDMEDPGGIIAKAGAPGGPNLDRHNHVDADGDIYHMGPSVPDMDHGGHVVLFDMDDDPFESSVYEGGLGGSKTEDDYPDPDPDDHDFMDDHGDAEEFHDKYANDWKPRQESVHEAFGGPIDDSWLEIG